MPLLKKIKASTLMETLVATVIIIVVFMIASMILNQVFGHSLRQETRQTDLKFKELYYRYQNHQLTLPYQEKDENWYFYVDLEEGGIPQKIMIEAQHQKNESILRKTYYAHQN